MRRVGAGRRRRASWLACRSRRSRLVGFRRTCSVRRSASSPNTMTTEATMPARQRGSVVKLPSGAWTVRFYDENGVRRRAGQAFATKTEAGDWLETKLEGVAALRRGDLPALRRQQMPTLSELV